MVSFAVLSLSLEQSKYQVKYEQKKHPAMQYYNYRKSIKSKYSQTNMLTLVI